MKQNDDSIRENLEHHFKQLQSEEDAPEELKNEVFQTLDTLSLLGDIVDLFTDKFTRTEAGFLDLLSDQEEEL